MTEPRQTEPLAGAHYRAMRMLGDEPLAKLVGRGSRHAFAALCERHSAALHRYCLSILRDEHDAQDALQSTMTQAYAALCERERDVSLRAWLFRIAHNESVTILRRRRRSATRDRTTSVQSEDPHAVLEARSRLTVLVADVKALPERQRAVLIMRELNGLGMHEISQVLDISPAVAKQSLLEARYSLRECDRGREMECEEARSVIATNDRRTLRGRRIKAHLRACQSCESYRDAIEVREADLRLLAPALPAVTLAATLARALGLAGRSARDGAIRGPGGSGQELLGHGSASALVKLTAGLAVIAGGAAGVTHVIVKSMPPRADSRPVAIVTERKEPGASDHGASTAATSLTRARAGGRRPMIGPSSGNRPRPAATHRAPRRRPVPPTPSPGSSAASARANVGSARTPSSESSTGQSAAPAKAKPRGKGRGESGKSQGKGSEHSAAPAGGGPPSGKPGAPSQQGDTPSRVEPFEREHESHDSAAGLGKQNESGREHGPSEGNGHGQSKTAR